MRLKAPEKSSVKAGYTFLGTAAKREVSSVQPGGHGQAHQTTIPDERQRAPESTRPPKMPDGVDCDRDQASLPRRGKPAVPGRDTLTAWKRGDPPASPPPSPPG